MLDELLKYLNKDGIQYLIDWTKSSLKSKFDKKNIVSLTSEEYNALINSGDIDPDVYYHVTDDYGTLVKYAYYVTFLASGWRKNSKGYYSQRVDVAGMTSDQTLFLVRYRENASLGGYTQYDDAFGLLLSGYGESLDGAIEYTLVTKPEVDITVGFMITDMMNTSTGATGGSGGSGVIVSDTEPEDESVELWVDTSSKGEIDIVSRDEVSDFIQNGVCADETGDEENVLAPVDVVMKSDILTLEEIQASTDLNGKVPSAEAVRQLDSELTEFGKFDNYVYLTFDGDIKNIDFDKYREIGICAIVNNIVSLGHVTVPTSVIMNGAFLRLEGGHYESQSNNVSYLVEFSYSSKTIKCSGLIYNGWSFEKILVYGIK